MTGIIENMPYDDYAAADGVNASLLKEVNSRSLLHAKAVMDGRRKKASDAMDFGTCFHSLLLEGREDFVVKPDTYAAPATHAKVKSKEIAEGDPLPWNGAAQICKDWLTVNAAGKIPLDSDEAAAVRGMCAVLRADPEIAQFLKGRCELSVFAEKDGHPMKCRIDTLPDGDSSPVIDFKKARTANPEGFVRQAIDLGYHLQAAHNLDVLRWAGIPRSEFWFVAIEDEPPFAYSIVKFKDQPGTFLRAGRAACRAAHLKIKGAVKTGKWTGYESGDAEVFAKAWHVPMIEQTL